jgi:hypothetical protein
VRARRAQTIYTVVEMTPIDTAGAREFLEATIAAFSVLGGGMAYFSGFAAARALAHEQSPEIVGQRINEGIAEGFELMSPLSIIAFIIVVWT